MEAERRSDPGVSALLTDLYQLTMLQTYYERGMTGTAVFELFFRRLPGLETLEQARDRARDQLARLPEALRSLEPAPLYPVAVSNTLKALAEEVDREQAAIALE